MKLQISVGRGDKGNYTAAVEGAGGQALTAFCPEPDLSCDGLILAGGEDVAPDRYGQENCGSQPPDLERDRAEFALFQSFSCAGKPISGICRGCQLVNVAMGGTLIQDLPPSCAPFHSCDGEGRDRVHTIRAEQDAPLYSLYGPLFPVTSHHHQALDRLGEGLRASAWSESGFPEAADCPSRRIFTVQFHPERMAFAHRRADTVDGAALFRWFLSLCR